MSSAFTVENAITSGTEAQSCAESTGEETVNMRELEGAAYINAADATTINTIINMSNPTTEFTDTSQIILNEPTQPLPGDSDKCDANKKPKPSMSDFLLQTLDEIEVRVEKMRETARSIDEEKSQLLDSLNTMMQSEAIDQLSEADSEELGLFIDRLVTRCLTVDISVQTIRTQSQEQSLHRVRNLLQELAAHALQESADHSRQRLQLYLNSCLASAESGPTDDRFQGAILGCAAEDQKLIRRKLQELWDTADQSDRFQLKLKAISRDV